MSTKPLSPSEVKIDLPDFVIQGINNTIQANYRGQTFNVKQNEIIQNILRIAPEGITRQVLFDNHWLDFEKLYEEFEWEVKYDKPGWDESYEAFFTFKPKRK